METTQDCYLLQLLSIDLIYCVKDFLNPVDIVLLSQTCHDLQCILDKHRNASQLPLNEYHSYLAIRARGLPGEFACMKCKALHSIVEHDTPTSIYDANSCPMSKSTISKHQKLQFDDRLYNNQIPIKHRHVQLALKYTRLQRHEYDSYLQALMKPYHNSSFTAFPEPDVRYSAYPKVVAGHDGILRFLIFSTWRYRRHQFEKTWPPRYKIICPHLRLTRQSYQKFFLAPKNTLERAIGDAIKDGAGGEEATISCHYCATDIAVWRSPDYLHLHAWQDFGVEGSSALDLDWVSHLYWTEGDSSTQNRRKLTVCNEPGAIRKLYGELPRCRLW